jgi:hypothetical protein
MPTPSPEPVILLDEPAEELSTGDASPRWRRLWPPLAVLAVAGALAIQHRTPPAAASPAAQPARTATARDAFHPSLGAPATARPGEAVTLMGYQHHGLCGDLEVRLDGSPVAVRTREIVDGAQPGWDGVVLAITLPAELTAGPHRIELLGPLPGRGGSRFPQCGNEAQGFGLIAATTATVGQ